MHKLITGSALALLISIPVQVCAADLIPGAVYGLFWDGDGIDDSATGAAFDGGNFDAINPGASPWTFSGAGTIGVLDLVKKVDQFTVFDNGVLVGTSSAPGGGSCGLDIEACFGDPGASKGLWDLGAGDHSITILANGTDTGFGVMQYTSAVPVPAAAWLFGSALLGLGAIKRRKA